MLNWLKFTFGSFTSNKLAKEGAERKFWNVVFALLLTIILMTALFAGGVNYSFAAHYNKASQFRDFAYNLFYEEKINVQVSEVEDGDNTIVSFYDLDKNQEVLINSFENETDKKYIKNDYNVIIDTRDPETTFVEFSIKFFKKDDNSAVDDLTYEEYLKLDNKNDYTGYIMPTSTVIEITSEDLANYEKYINEEFIVLDNVTDDAKNLWNDINKLDKTTSEYKNQVYDYYVKAYYGINTTPNIVYYYQSTYGAFDENNNYKYKNFLVLTKTWAMVSLTTDKDVLLVYDGYFNDLKDGFILRDSHTNVTKETITNNVDILISYIYSSVDSLRTLIIGTQLFRYTPIMILALAILGLFIFCVGRLKKGKAIQYKYMACFKITSSFLIGSATIAGVITLICSFFTNSQISMNVGTWALLSILSIRTFIFAIIEIIKARKFNFETSPVTKDNEPITINDNENNLNDLSKVETGTKIINNDDVDDEDEKMELM